jgi:hypothetical protein
VAGVCSVAANRVVTEEEGGRGKGAAGRESPTGPEAIATGVSIPDPLEEKWRPGGSVTTSGAGGPVVTATGTGAEAEAPADRHGSCGWSSS